MATQNFNIELGAAVAKQAVINDLVSALRTALGHDITLPRPERGTIPSSSDKPDASIQGAIKNLLDQIPHPIQPVFLTYDKGEGNLRVEVTVKNIAPHPVTADFHVYNGRQSNSQPLGVKQTGHLELEADQRGTFTIEIPLHLCENQSPVLWVTTGAITPKAFLSLSLEDEEKDSESEDPEPEPGDKE